MGPPSRKTPRPARWPVAVGFWLAAGGAAGAAVVINEIHYNSPGSPDVEFVELHNTGPGTVNLAGWYLLDDSDGNPPCPLAGSLGVGEFLVVAGRLDTFAATYPSVTQVNPFALDGSPPGTGFALGNTADSVRLFDASDQLVDRVDYTESAPWPAEADGNGPSLELRNPLLDNALPGSWGASQVVSPGGTPGGVNSIHEANPPPAILSVARSPSLPDGASSVRVSATVDDDGPLSAVRLFVSRDGGAYLPTAMLDDGASPDPLAGDGEFSATIGPAPDGTPVRYWVEAVDAFQQSDASPAGAPATWYGYTVGHLPPPLRITEIQAWNLTTLTDEAGDNDDWIELWNPGPLPIGLGGRFLSDSRDDSMRWALPQLTLEPGQRVLVWADGEPGEGSLHASFALSRFGGEVALFDAVDLGNVEIDGFGYGVQNADASFGRRPDGTRVPEYLLDPTPATSNDAAGLYSAIAINEFLASSQVPGRPDWIELYNRGSVAVDLGGWSLSDTPSEPTRFTFPTGTVLAPGATVSVDESQLGFGIAAGGNEVLLLTTSAGAVGQDWWDFGPQLSDVSSGRVPDGGPVRQLLPTPSRDLPNACSGNLTPLDAVDGLVAISSSGWTWPAVGGAEAYDTLRGDLGAWAGEAPADAVAAAARICISDDRIDPFAWDPALPPAGTGWFYLVRAVNFACRTGSWDSGGAGQVASRDPGLAQAGATCP